MIDDISFNYIDKDGNNKKYIIIDKFSKNNKDFIIFKEDNLDVIYTAIYKIMDDKIKIIPIENNNDYDIVDQYLESL